MTLERLFAKAVAFNASKDARHVAGLSHAEREVTLGMASYLRDGLRQRDILATYRRPVVTTGERDYRRFWTDQRATPQVLP